MNGKFRSENHLLRNKTIIPKLKCCIFNEMWLLQYLEFNILRFECKGA